MNIAQKKLIPVPFPSCSDVLLSQVTRGIEDDITIYFNEYFAFEKHNVIEDYDSMFLISWEAILSNQSKILKDFLKKDYGIDWLDGSKITKENENEIKIVSEDAVHLLFLRLNDNQTKLALEIDGESTDEFIVRRINGNHRIYVAKYDEDLIEALDQLRSHHIKQEETDCSCPPVNDCSFPSVNCLPPSCVTLKGKRRLTDEVIKKGGRIRRLFIGDLAWLFYFEKMGIFKILGVILDDFATKGKIPLPNDEALAIVLETMVRNTKMGLSSTVRDRNSSYRRCLGWATDAGKNLQMDTMVNSGFSNLLHRLIQNTLEYFKHKRLADVLEKGSPSSIATLTTIGNTIEVLKKSFKPFDYGRNHLNTLNGIVWVIAAMDMIKRSRENLGIPREFDSPHEFIPAAYDILVMGKPITPSELNRYIIHKECAQYVRAILLDLEFLDHTKTERDGELQVWLDSIEDEIEGYRTAYRTLTGVDVGIPPAPGTPIIEQQV